VGYSFLGEDPLPHYLEQRYRIWYATLDIPKDVRPFLRKRRFFKSLETDNKATALRRVALVVAQWKGEIEALRKGTRDPIEADIRFLRQILTQARNEGDESAEEVIRDELIVRGQQMDAVDPGAGSIFYKRAMGYATDTTEHLDDWIAATRGNQKTKDMKKSDVKRFAARFPTLEEVSHAEVTRWTNALMSDEEDGIKAKTVVRILSACRGYWRYLQSIEAVQRDKQPFQGLEVGRTAKRTAPKDMRRDFAPEDVVKLWKAAETRGDNELVDLIRLAMWTGCRIEELCSLKAERVKEDRLDVEDAKTKAGWRTVPLHPKVKDTMARLVGKRTTGYIMANLTENKYGDRSNAVGKRFGRLKTDLGFGPPYVFHSIRKTVATLLEAAQVPEVVAARILGHEFVTMSYGLYSENGTTFETKREALEKIDYPPA
jgi:integrase